MEWTLNQGIWKLKFRKIIMRMNYINKIIEYRNDTWRGSLEKEKRNSIDIKSQSEKKISINTWKEAQRRVTHQHITLITKISIPISQTQAKATLLPLLGLLITPGKWPLLITTQASTRHASPVTNPPIPSRREHEWHVISAPITARGRRWAEHNLASNLVQQPLDAAAKAR